MDGYLPKPIDPVRLAQEIRRVTSTPPSVRAVGRRAELARLYFSVAPVKPATALSVVCAAFRPSRKSLSL